MGIISKVVNQWRKDILGKNLILVSSEISWNSFGRLAVRQVLYWCRIKLRGKTRSTFRIIV